MTKGTKKVNELTFPDDRRYSREHVWLSENEGRMTVGITDYAQDQLGEIIFVDLPGVGDSFQQDQEFGVVESAKTSSELFVPVAGEIMSINADLEDEPSLINRNPYGEGWLATIEPAEGVDLNGLMSRDEYMAFLSGREE